MHAHLFPDRPFTLRQATDAGINRNRVHIAVRNGVLRRVLRGEFVRADIPDTVELRAAAARLVVGPTSVVSDRTAAWIHGVAAGGAPPVVLKPPVVTN